MVGVGVTTALGLCVQHKGNPLTYLCIRVEAEV